MNVCFFNEKFTDKMIYLGTKFYIYSWNSSQLIGQGESNFGLFERKSEAKRCVGHLALPPTPSVVRGHPEQVGRTGCQVVGFV